MKQKIQHAITTASLTDVGINHQHVVELISELHKLPTFSIDDIAEKLDRAKTILEIVVQCLVFVKQPPDYYVGAIKTVIDQLSSLEKIIYE